jgi:proton-coupled amino acid transporter
MQDASHFPPLLRKAMMILAALFSSFGLCGYAAYGPEVRDMITFSIPQNKITSFLRLFYCLGIFFTYPVMMFPLFGVTEGKSRWLRDSRHWWRSAVWRSVPMPRFSTSDDGRESTQLSLVGLTGIIGMQIPHFGLFLGLIGSVATTSEVLLSQSSNDCKFT